MVEITETCDFRHGCEANIQASQESAGGEIRELRNVPGAQISVWYVLDCWMISLLQAIIRFSTDLRRKLKQILMARIAEVHRRGIHISSSDMFDFLGLGLGAWVESYSSDHIWLINEPVAFDVIFDHVAKQHNENMGKFLISNAARTLLVVINGNPAMNSKGGPAEKVIGASFLQSEFLGKKVRLCALCSYVC